MVLNPPCSSPQDFVLKHPFVFRPKKPASETRAVPEVYVSCLDLRSAAPQPSAAPEPPLLQRPGSPAFWPLSPQPPATPERAPPWSALGVHRCCLHLCPRNLEHQVNRYSLSGCFVPRSTGPGWQTLRRELGTCLPARKKPQEGHRSGILTGKEDSIGETNGAHFRQTEHVLSEYEILRLDPWVQILTLGE